jgi:hypothetical protein
MLNLTKLDKTAFNKPVESRRSSAPRRKIKRARKKERKEESKEERSNSWNENVEYK